MTLLRFWQSVVLVTILWAPLSWGNTHRYDAFDDKSLQDSLKVGLAHSLNYTFQFAARDKQYHYAAGMLVGSGASILASKYFKGSEYSRLKSSLVGTGTSILVAVGKEMHDARYGGSVELMDALYTAVAGSLFSFRIQF